MTAESDGLTDADIETMRAAHRDSYPMGNIHHGTPANPEWGTFCVECKESWPCEVARLIEHFAPRVLPPGVCDGSFVCEAETHDEGCFATYVTPPGEGEPSCMTAEKDAHRCDTPPEAMPGDEWTCPVCGLTYWADDTEETWGEGTFEWRVLPPGEGEPS